MKPDYLTDEEYNKTLRDQNLWSAKKLIISEMINNEKFYTEFMEELRFRFLLEKVKIKLNSWDK